MPGDEPGRPPVARSAATLRRWRRKLAEERDAALVYRQLANRRAGEEREILLGLAEAEERHAAYWERLLGEQAGPRRPSLRARLQGLMARRFGWVFVLALMEQAERRSRTSGPDVPASMAADEVIHSEVVRGLAARGRSRMSGTLRAGVFGINDGLVSNFALVLGVIGGGASDRTVLLTGLAGLLAGALSMAAGEFISVSSQRELLAASNPGEAKVSVTKLDVRANELALVYRARGMPAEEAQRHADEVLRGGHVGPGTSRSDADRAEVVGSGFNAAWSSFLFFSVGALIPVVPFLLGLSGPTAVVVAAVLTGLALMATGATVGVLSGGPPGRRALRQLGIAAGAALVTYLLGLAFGTVVG